MRRCTPVPCTAPRRSATQTVLSEQTKQPLLGSQPQIGAVTHCGITDPLQRIKCKDGIRHDINRFQPLLRHIPSSEIASLSCRAAGGGLGRKLVRIYHRGRLVKLHPRQLRGVRSTAAADYPSKLTAYILRASDVIRRSAAEQGPVVAEFAEHLFAGPLPWARIRQGHKLLRLGR